MPTQVSRLPQMSECIKCGMCCRSTTGPVVFPSDAERLGSVLGIGTLEFLRQFCCPFCLPRHPAIRIFTLRVEDGHCIFLNKSCLCDIYESRPYQCRMAPFGFLAKYRFWQHMPCIRKEAFLGADSSAADRYIMLELLSPGYPNID